MSGERLRLGCIVDQCPNNSKTRKRPRSQIRFYPFPDEPVIKEKWMKILGLVGYKNENIVTICSLHFQESDFEINEVGKFVLKRNAIPLVNLDLILLDNEVLVDNISNTEDTLNVGVLRNRISGPEVIPKNPEDTDLSYDFLHTLRNSFFNSDYCKDYSYQLISTCLDDISLENLITATKKGQISALRNVKISTNGGSYNYKQRLYLYIQEERNRTYAEIKSRCFGRCRLCLYCFKHSDLFLFSSRFTSDKDVTIRDYLMSLFPSLADNFQLDHEICFMCYENLLTTLQFFKMTLTVEGLLNTVLKDQPFIFNEEELETVVVKKEIEVEDGNTNTSPRSFNGTMKFRCNMEGNCEVSTEPIFDETPYSLLNNFEDSLIDNSFAMHIDNEDTKNDNITQACYGENNMFESLRDHQKDVLSKVLTLIAPIKSEDESDNFDYNDDFTGTDGNKHDSDDLLGMNSGNDFSYCESVEPQNNQIATESDRNGIPCNDLADLPLTNNFVSFPAGFSDVSQFIEDTSLADINVISLTRLNKPGKVVLLGNDNLFLKNESDSDSEKAERSHLQDFCFVNIKADAEISDIQEDIKCEENNDLTDPNVQNEHSDFPSRDLYALSNDMNSGYTYNSNNDLIMSDNDNSIDEKYSMDDVNSAYSRADENISAMESILLSELDKESVFLPNLTVVTPPMLNSEDLEVDFLDKVKVISLDSSATREKRIIFLGGLYCGVCLKNKVTCRCVKLGKRRVLCDKCGRKFRGAELKRHAPTCGTRFSCERCNTSYLTKSKYKHHLRKIADAPVCNYLKCKICLVKFTQEDFKEHIEEHPNYLCQNCGKSFMSSNQLYAHMRCHVDDHKQEATVVCQLCGKLVSTRRYSLQKHLRLHALHDKGRKETCDICKKMFYTARELRKHKLTHRGDKYPCDICDKEFSSTAAAKVHYQVVHMKKPIATCEICKHEFTRRDYYRLHLRRHHSGATARPKGRPKIRKKDSGPVHLSRHKCRLCPMTFGNVSNKQRHEKLHENPHYQFSCKICHCRNKSEKELLRHMNKSHSKKPTKIYKCHHCNEQFNKKYFLLHHIRNIHSIVEVPTEEMDRKKDEETEGNELLKN